MVIRQDIAVFRVDDHAGAGAAYFTLPLLRRDTEESLEERVFGERIAGRVDRAARRDVDDGGGSVFDERREARQRLAADLGRQGRRCGQCERQAEQEGRGRRDAEGIRNICHEVAVRSGGVIIQHAGSMHQILEMVAACANFAQSPGAGHGRCDCCAR